MHDHPIIAQLKVGRNEG